MINKWLLLHVAHADLANENSRFYGTILSAYAHPRSLAIWARHVAPVFETLFKVFFFSNFTFLPALFLIALVTNLITRRPRMERTERWVLLTAVGLFLFINLAPAYKERWQFHGWGVARIYQPVFGVMLLYVARTAQAFFDERQHAKTPRKDLVPWRLGVLAFIPLCTLVDASIALGPVTLNPLAEWAYHRFYMNARAPQMRHNLALFGRRPLGFCNRKINIENPPPKRHGPKVQSKAQKQRVKEKLYPPKKVTKAQRERLKAKRNSRPPPTRPATGPSAPAAASAPSPGG
jgi:hypothetical protein